MSKSLRGITPPDFTLGGSNEGVRVVLFLAGIGQSHVVRGTGVKGLSRAGPRWVSAGSDMEDSAVVCQRAGVVQPLPLCASLTGNADQRAIATLA